MVYRGSGDSPSTVLDDGYSDLFDGVDHRWWRAKKAHVTEGVFAAYRHLRNDDSRRLEQNRRHKRLYAGPDRGDVDLWDAAHERPQVALNIIKNAIDAVVAKIGKQRPAPKPLTTGGSPDLQRKAKLLERFLQAQFDISGVYEEMPRAFLDACVFGTGVVRVWREGTGKKAKLCCERVYPSEIYVDRHDGLYGRPRWCIQKKWIARETALQMYPKKRAEIEASQADDEAESDSDDLYYDRRSDQILVLEAHRVATDSQPGRRVICVRGGCLADEEWKHTWLPYVFLTWSERLRGFWGMGVAEELTGIQLEINQLLGKIQSAFHLMAVPRVFVDVGSKIQKSHFNNQVGVIVPYVGKPPVVNTPQTVHPEVFAHLDRLYNRAYEIVGISQLSARQKNPLGADASGVALQTWHDMETERFSIQAAKYEQAFLDLAERLIAFAREAGGEFAAPSERDRNTIDRIDWSQVDMQEDQYVLRVFPVSALPSTPAGRLAAVIQMVNAGLVDLPTAQRLLQFPDIEAEMSLDRATGDLLDHVIELMLDEGAYTRPEPFMDLELALKKAQLWYSKALRMGAEEERLELLRRFMRQTNVLLEARQVQQQAVAAQVAGQNAPTNPAAPPAAGPAGAPPTAVTPQDGAVSLG